MKLTINSNKSFYLIFFVFILLNVILVLNMRLYPFIDLPFRLAAATIVRYYEEPNNQFAQYYLVDLFLKPNIIHIIFCSLKIFPSVEFANKIFYCMYIIALPLSVLLVIRKLGRNVWLAMLSFLVLYNFNVIWGFSEFTISIPIVIFLIYFLIDYFAEDNLRQSIAIAVLLMVLFFTHVIAQLFSLFIFFICCVYNCRNSFSQLIKKTIVTVPSVIIFLLWRFFYTSSDSQGVMETMVFHFENSWMHMFINRFFEMLVFNNYGMDDGYVGKAVAILCSLVIIIPFLNGLILPNQTINDKNNKKLFLLYLFFSTSFLFCISMPDRFKGAYYLYQRFFVFLFLSLIFLNNITYTRKPNRVIIAAICALCVAHFILWSRYFINFQMENQSFTKSIFGTTSENDRLGGFIYAPHYKGTRTYMHFTNYYIVWQQGIASTMLVDYRFGPIHRKVTEELLPQDPCWISVLKNYDDRYINMDYLLVRGEIPQPAKKYFENFQVVRSVENWTLWENNGF